MVELSALLKLILHSQSYIYQWGPDESRTHQALMAMLCVFWPEILFSDMICPLGKDQFITAELHYILTE